MTRVTLDYGNRRWGREWNFLSIMQHRTYAKRGNNLLIGTYYSAVMIMVQKTWLEIVWRSVLFPLQQFTVLASRIYSKLKLKDKQTTRLRHSSAHAMLPCAETRRKGSTFKVQLECTKNAVPFAPYFTSVSPLSSSEILFGEMLTKEIETQ